MSLRPLIRSTYVSRVDEALAEAEGIAVMRRSSVLIRAYESAPHDFVVVIDPNDVIDLPDRDSTDYEFWKWAIGIDDNLFLSMDVKYYRLVNSIFSRHKEYSFSTGRKEAVYNVGSDGQLPQVAVLVFEGVHDYLALLPYHTWRLGGTCGTVLQSLEQTIPAWCQPFMVHYDDLGTAMLSLTSVLKARKGSYRNPTTGVVLEGWRPRTTAEAQIQATVAKNHRLNRVVQQSVNAVTSFWSKLESAGGKIIWNPVAPFFFDFSCHFPGLTAPLDVEHKCSNQSPKAAARSLWNRHARKSPFHPRHIWHVIVIECKKGIICFTRDEIRKAPNQDAYEKLAASHVFTDFAKLASHIVSHEAAARQAVQEVIQELRPSDLSLGYNVSRAQASLRTMHKIPSTKDPLMRYEVESRSRLVPSWFATQMNNYCCAARYGIVYALDAGHKWGNHIFVHHEWQEHETKAFRQTGAMPFPVYAREPEDSLLHTMKVPIPVGKRLLKPEIDQLDIAHLEMGLFDGTLYNALYRILQGEQVVDMGCSLSPTKGRKALQLKNTADYISTVSAVLQAVWDYGVTTTRKFKARGKGKRKARGKAYDLTNHAGSARQAKHLRRI
ncbi:hypothetical protein KC333_g8883 [Hortaea werneckii]|nr:hypothetical protein KC333_g8883 [Hortaea werneckii]KAI7302777.1 hypothetical protein KC326_g8877 [Hortaea werneckii]